MFSWKPAQPRYVKRKIFLFLKAYNTRSIRSKATEIVVENLTNSFNSGKCRHLFKKAISSPKIYFLFHHHYPIRSPLRSFFVLYDNEKREFQS